MYAVTVPRHGAADVLTYGTADGPEPGAQDVLVDVSLAGVNYLDVYHRNGVLAPPFIAGVEGVGIVVDSFGRWTAGDRVGWLSAQGSYAQQIAVHEDKLVALPDDIKDSIAVALLMQGVTAHYLAMNMTIIDERTVAVVHAGAGGVGRLLIQILKHLGATVIATASTEPKRDLARQAGADHACDYGDLVHTVRDATSGAGVQVVYDGVGAPTVDDSLQSLAVRGTYVCIGAAGGPARPIDVKELAVRSLSVSRPSVAHYTADPGELRVRTGQVFDWYCNGVLTPEIAATYPLREASAAHTRLESRDSAGKVVLQVVSPTD